jgi:FAD:protein FMN transferase
VAVLARIAGLGDPGGGHLMMSFAERAQRIMGTAVAIEGPDPADPAVEAAMDHLRRVESVFSTFLPDSEISRVNAGTLAIEDASDEVQDVLLRCELFRGMTDGAFDHHVGERIDPAGYVKGWAVDGAADILLAGGITDFMIWAGGDIRTSGHPPDEESWSIGIRHPADEHRVIAAVDLVDGAIATSGRYERGDHIRGSGTDGLASVSIVGPRLAIADSLATAVMAVGLDRAGWLTGFPDYRLIALADDGRLLRWESSS